jgi:putative ABC transport system substrate-binding protein
MQLGQLKRRNFISLLGSAVVWPLVAHAQQPAAQPLIGFLSTRSPEEAAIHTSAFRRGLEEMGFVEGAPSPLSTAGQGAIIASCRL